MIELIQNFPTQLEEALQIAKTSGLKLKGKTYSDVVVSGLGGSGIGATILQDFVYDKISIPFVVNKTYHIPKHVSKQTLFIACSYSGNTEETIAAYEEARKRKATVVCVSSGGELIERAKKHKQAFVQIPAGNPPRASIGYSLVQLIFILSKAGLISSQEKEIRSSITLLQKQTSSIQTAAQLLASKLPNKYLAIYTTVGHEGLAIRFRQQLNENSKILAWHNVIPEMTHNEIVGWKHANEDVFVLFAYHPKDYSRNIDRLKFLKKVLLGYKANMADLVMKGQNYWEHVFYFIHYTDWVSIYLAELNKQDAGEVRVIDGLKKTMSKK